MSDERQAIDEYTGEYPPSTWYPRYFNVLAMKIEIMPRAIAEPATDPYELEHD